MQDWRNGMNLTDRTFVITGGASGLGWATARRLLDRGAKVAVVDLPAALEKVAVDQSPSRLAKFAADVTDTAQLSAAIDSAEAELGPLSGAVCCAGILGAARVVGRDGPHSLELFERVVRVNLLGTFNVIRLVAASMIRSGGEQVTERGAIITVSSVAASEGQIGQAAYSAAKGGVAAMTLPIARELAQHAIRVVSIAPGVFETPMIAAMPEASRQSLLSQTVYPPRLGLPEEFAQLAQSILENPMLNGAVIRLDGAVRMGAK